MATSTDSQLCCWLQKSVDSVSSVETKECCQLFQNLCGGRVFFMVCELYNQ